MQHTAQAQETRNETHHEVVAELGRRAVVQPLSTHPLFTHVITWRVINGYPSHRERTRVP